MRRTRSQQLRGTGIARELKGRSVSVEKKIKKTPITELPARGQKQILNVVIDTPKGSRNKYKYDEKRGLFRLSRVLPSGAIFPFDFGFLPSTKAEDGDPLDVLLLMDVPAFPGCLVEARLLGVLEAEQREEDGRLVRNDRLLAVAKEAPTFDDIHEPKDLSPILLNEVVHFFVSYNQISHKEFRPLGLKGPEVAWKAVEDARGTKKKHAA
jgi:inorganic pyrophosphatase